MQFSQMQHGPFAPPTIQYYGPLQGQQYPCGVFNWEKIKNVPNWDVFEKKSILTEVRVSVDAHGPGDHGLGAGLVV